MADAGFREHGAQTVEDRLVGDFAGEADIARRYFSDLGRHQRPAPVRRRARQMRHAAAAEPGKMIGDRLAGARQHQRRAADDRAQKDLQAAIAADVVERAPHDGAVETLPGADRRDQAGKAVHRHLRHAGRAGREQHPFGRHLRQRKLLGRDDGRRANDTHWKIECRLARRARVDHDGVGLGAGEQSVKMIGCGIGRQDRQPARHAVELDQRQRTRELARRRDDDRAAGKLRKPAAKTRSVRELIDANAAPRDPRRIAPALRRRRGL